MVLRGSAIKGTTVSNFIYGGIAGCCSRTLVAPLDRVKILMQTTKSHLSLSHTIQKIISEEGMHTLWKGNVLNCSRILPYSGLQFGSYDLCKSAFFEQPLTIPERLACGTAAGFMATTATHPLDTIRHRILMYNDIHTFGQATRSLMSERGLLSLFKGYGSTITGLVPFIAVNFCTFDTLKSNLQWTSTPGILTMGAGAAIISQSICYPLDTIRRRMQIKGTPYKHGADALFKIVTKEGAFKLYAGISANALKIIPNNSIRFLVYEWTCAAMDFKNNI